MKKLMISIVTMVMAIFIQSCEIKVTIKEDENKNKDSLDHEFLIDGGTVVLRNGAEIKMNIEDMAHRISLNNGVELSVMIESNQGVVR